jgi:CDP-diacylglycerol---glycerol-3-phosphate 3-phosphatidyltransferase
MRATEAKPTQQLVPKLESRDAAVNLPNLLTFARLLLIPVFIVLLSQPGPQHSIGAAVVFSVAALTDLLDGYFARRRAEITRLGRLLDPIADKLLVLSGLILLVETHRVSAVIAILMIAREVAVTGIRAIASAEGIVMSAETSGKYKMTAQVVAIVLLILVDGVDASWNFQLLGTLFLYAALILGFYSGSRYLMTFWRAVSLKGI